MHLKNHTADFPVASELYISGNCDCLEILYNGCGLRSAVIRSISVKSRSSIIAPNSMLTCDFGSIEPRERAPFTNRKYVNNNKVRVGNMITRTV